MAKATMGRSRFKIQRRLGIELPGLGKAGALERRPYAPGQHGNRRRKISEFTIRLMEKQKVIFHYGLRENQLRNYVRKCKKVRDRPWADVLVESLEKRLDNVVFRLNFAPSIIAARQMISHGHVIVNGKKIKLPGVSLKVGDKIELTSKGQKSGNYLQAKEKPRMVSPAYLKKEAKGETEVGELVSAPLPEDIPFEFEKRLLIEYYWRI